MIDAAVRRAEPTDAPALAALEAMARGALVEARGGRRWLQEHPAIGGDWVATIAERAVFVADLRSAGTEEAVPVGYLVLDAERPVAVVDQVFVEPAARELGAGDALLAAATAHAREIGAELLEGEALPGDRDTKNLYERAGITARLIVVSTRL